MKIQWLHSITVFYWRQPSTTNITLHTVMSRMGAGSLPPVALQAILQLCPKMDVRAQRQQHLADITA